MTHRIEPYTSKHMIARARRLRRDAPVPERLLWGMLRGRRLGGLKFRRQQPVGPYVADFFCERARLVVELDGQSHFGQQKEDTARDQYMRGRGLQVLRIANDELLRNREGVAETIHRAAEARVNGWEAVPRKPSPDPSQGEGG
jgi:very-short-patch-repair endonuclease